MSARLLIISPVRNEAAHLERVARALAAQQRPPERWILVDDASTDGTLELARGLAAELPFLEVYEAPRDTPHAGATDRLARAAAPRNFNVGLAHADWHDYTHVMKLDGDIELPPSYLRILLERFAADPRLGIAGGYLVEPRPDGTARRIPIPGYHVHGALKCYARSCFEAIGGVHERLGWDTIDETYARMRGFTTVSFDDLVSIHHRAWGSADGVLRGRARLGECAWILQYRPSWVLLRAARLALTEPRGRLGAAYLLGYLRAGLRRITRVEDPAYRRFVRREQRERMLTALRSRFA